MLYQYPALAKINETGKSIEVSNQSVIQSLPGLNGVDYFVKHKNHHDYYAFVDNGKQGGAVVHTDNYSDLGFVLIETPLSDFYLDINPETNLSEMYDGAGIVTDFTDAVEEDEIKTMWTKFTNSSDEDLENSDVYKELDKYVSQYLELDEETERKVNLSIIRVAILRLSQDSVEE
ncbi:ABC-type multidrug transport system, ATPase and permease component [Pediococcus damnosus]|uniref:ABC-type multidrug transport system, ATPase and permease component n=1 Tax=Pediococcus damnosus TaxID=51663 RepID=A0A0R2HHF5_9LACO|nr:hypothetical protein [Pediococcus damnosus]AMV60222.1 ABC-type multidrug transport system [Pediococcus damnosus]AMV62748.1 ABC-type multidrug transport system, ATPase and permease component [Pediococcus damnosus]AMV64472.1 ABC-type multidrug transport system, ATPase and permease component [Pediococcus damnosus]AMV67371.1 ABC-type multidrug transport system, ATPase and permease component [Pediococcus damnosus]AMV69669.1 ABC-type multidrug transport system, ATPase and permease component [Pedi